MRSSPHGGYTHTDRKERGSEREETEEVWRRDGEVRATTETEWE